jgi:maleate cis-trans isomerase
VVHALQKETGGLTVSTTSALPTAFAALGARRLVIVMPYRQQTNEPEIAFLTKAGIEALHYRGLSLQAGVTALRGDMRHARPLER